MNMSCNPIIFKQEMYCLIDKKNEIKHFLSSTCKYVVSAVCKVSIVFNEDFENVWIKTVNGGQQRTFLI